MRRITMQTMERAIATEMAATMRCPVDRTLMSMGRKMRSPTVCMMWMMISL